MGCAKLKKLRSGQRVPCLKCEGCKADKLTSVVQAIRLELAAHPFSRFVTLTFEDQYLPRSRSELESYARRARRGLPYRSILVSERGDRATRRAHFHLIVFGQPHEGAVEFWRLRWKFGNPDIQDANQRWCAPYIAKYLVKGVGDFDVMQFYPDGLGPNLVRRPSRPPLGCSIVPQMAARLRSSRAAMCDMALFHDVPSRHRMDGFMVRTPRSVVTRLRAAFGLPSSSAERSVVQEIRRADAAADPLYSAKMDRKRVVRAELAAIKATRLRARRVYSDPLLRFAEKRCKAAIAAGEYVPRSVVLARRREARKAAAAAALLAEVSSDGQS